MGPSHSALAWHVVGSSMPFGVTARSRGRWLTNKGTLITSELKSWLIQVPGGLSQDQRFEFVTVYQLALPRAKLRVHVPRREQSGDFVEFLELRMNYALRGYRSYDASSQDVMKSLGDCDPWQTPTHRCVDGLSLDFEPVRAHCVPYHWTTITDSNAQK